MTSPTATSTPTPVSPQGLSSRLALLVLVCVAQFMLVIDDTIVNVALPTISSELKMDEGGLSWVANAYLLTFGGFLLIGGRAADMIGRRKMFALSMAAFFIASAVCGIAGSPEVLIAARGAQGLAGAMMSPAALSILLAAFRNEQDRTRALAIWSALMALGAATGLVLGGMLVDWVNWRWVFWINLPVGLIALSFVRGVLPDDRGQERASAPDVFGASLITVAMLLLVYTVVETADHGWFSLRSLLSFGVVAALVGAFAKREAGIASPLLPASLRSRPHIAWANSLMFVAAGALLAMFFIMTLYMQNILRYSALETGLAFLPFSAAMVVISGIVTKAIERFSVRPFLVIGPIAACIGLYMLSRLRIDSEYANALLPALIVCGIGMGLSFVPLMEAGTAGVPERDSGIASGALTSFQQIGGAVGIATLITIATNVASSKVAAGAAAPVAAMHGFERALLVSAGMMVVASVFGTLTSRKLPRKIEGDRSDDNVSLSGPSAGPSNRRVGVKAIA